MVPIKTTICLKIVATIQLIQRPGLGINKRGPMLINTVMITPIEQTPA